MLEYASVSITPDTYLHSLPYMRKKPVQAWYEAVGPKRVGDSGCEPLASSASKKYDGLLEISGDCKMPANRSICALPPFSAFQEICSGCCTKFLVRETSPIKLGRES
jgi:hypothetical protein